MTNSLLTNIVPLLQGLGLGMSLIVAIGAQNAFVLKQGIKHEHMFLSAITCSLIDALLIALGVAGFGTLISSHPTVLLAAKWFGVAFLFYYGFKSFKAAFHKEKLDISTVKENPHRAKKVFMLLLAFSFLNPHVYLDTVILTGTIASQHPPEERVLFALGAIFASFIWFFSLAYGARVLNPIFKKPKAWKILDTVIGIIMWTIALTLIFEI